MRKFSKTPTSTAVIKFNAQTISSDGFLGALTYQEEGSQLVALSIQTTLMC